MNILNYPTGKRNIHKICIQVIQIKYLIFVIVFKKEYFIINI
jgi:hypothetical protein